MRMFDVWSWDDLRAAYSCGICFADAVRNLVWGVGHPPVGLDACEPDDRIMIETLSRTNSDALIHEARWAVTWASEMLRNYCREHDVPADQLRAELNMGVLPPDWGNGGDPLSL
jgi:hypothetical protein